MTDKRIEEVSKIVARDDNYCPTIGFCSRGYNKCETCQATRIDALYSARIEKKNGEYQCSHIKKDIIDAYCPWCQLTVAERAVDELKAKLKAATARFEKDIIPEKIARTLNNEIVSITYEGKQYYPLKLHPSVLDAEARFEKAVGEDESINDYHYNYSKDIITIMNTLRSEIRKRWGNNA